MSTNNELHVALFDGSYLVCRFVAESTIMSNVYSAAVNLVERNKKQLSSEEYFVEVRDTNGGYVTRVKQNKHTQNYLAGFLTNSGYSLEWHEIKNLINPSYQFKFIKPLL